MTPCALPGTLAPVNQELASRCSVSLEQSAMCRAQPACAASVASMVVKPASRIAASRSTTQSTCCSIETAIFDNTEGLPGPVIMNKLGKRATVSLRELCGPLAQTPDKDFPARPVIG